MISAPVFDEATSKRRVIIDLERIVDNLARYRALSAGPVIARVDHDAFGHGLLPVARALAAHADCLAVADLDEANALRGAGLRVPLLAMRPSGAALDDPREVHVAVASPEEALQARTGGARSLHLVIDAGAAARGIRAGAASDFPTAADVTGIFGCYGPDISPAQAGSVFDAVLAERPETPFTHLHGTRGIESGAASEAGRGVRLGRGLYGIPSADGAAPAPFGELAMSVRGTVITVKRIAEGEGVSYGYTYRAPADGRIALVAGGYAQGVLRSLGNQVSVTLNGARHPIIGRVAMDVCVIDLGDAPATAEDVVEFLGSSEDLARWAATAGLTPAEIAVGLANFFQRSYR